MWQAAVLAFAFVAFFLPHLERRDCPGCGTKSLRRVRPGLFQESLDWVCPCGYRWDSGVVIRTSWSVVAALVGATVAFGAYMIVRYG